MSKTACWGTNELNVDIATVHFGYGSRFDLSWFQVSLEALRVMSRYDFMYENREYPLHGGGKNFGKKIEWEDATWEQRYEASPVFIKFDGLTEKENLEKAVEWYKSIIDDNHIYGSPEFSVRYESPNGGLHTANSQGEHITLETAWVGVPKKFPDHEIMTRIMDMHHMLESHCFGGRHSGHESIDMYLGGNSYYRSKYNDYRSGVQYYKEYQFESYAYVGWETLDDIVQECFEYAKMLCERKYKKEYDPDCIFGRIESGNEKIVNVEELEHTVKVSVSDGGFVASGLAIVFDKRKYKGKHENHRFD